MSRRDRTTVLKNMVAAYWASQRYAVFFEVKLSPRKTRVPAKRCRCDVLAVNTKGHIVITEVKSGRADYTADHKHHLYLPYCNRMFFALPPDMKVPEELRAHPEVGVLVPRADGQVLRVVKRASRRLVSGKLKRSTVLHLLYRAADHTRFGSPMRTTWTDSV